jgi:hypothetical protein
LDKPWFDEECSQFLGQRKQANKKMKRGKEMGKFFWVFVLSDFGILNTGFLL